jgi:DNA repair protein RecO (recombination protein O)
MEWEAPAAILDVRPYNDADALVTVMTEPHGTHRALVRGGLSRKHASVWQPGNLIQARWIGRLPDQLGTLTAEPVLAAAAQAMDNPVRLAVLSAACAVAEGALPEREAHPIVFGGLVGLVAGLDEDPAPVETLVRWEAALLTELGYGMDLATCAVTGGSDDLRYVSPRSGRAVAASAAGAWESKLLALPAFLKGGPGTAAGWRDGLLLTGHFLARDAFGIRHRPLPAARVMLYDRVAALAAEPHHP